MRQNVRVLLLAFVMSHLAGAATESDGAEPEDEMMLALAADDGCRMRSGGTAEDVAASCAVSLRQLRGQLVEAKSALMADTDSSDSADPLPETDAATDADAQAWTSPKAQCSANAGCVQVGLTDGPCCPTADGVNLGCCSEEPGSPALCSKNPGCAAINLTDTRGPCCPTVDGVMLGCCGAEVQVNDDEWTPYD
mmetsp:Transcript_92448/g.198207  ORF Transcript_92448/g.198207 Transcript_92448/m.198207 type:complete len:194 (-) Transcript_92448:79-660(-)